MSRKPLIFQSVMILSLLLCLQACGGSTNKETAAAPASLGDQLRKRGDDASAANAYHQDLQKNPGDSAARQGLAEIYESHGDTARAAEQYRVLLQNDPANADAHRALGRILLRQGQAADAKAEYEKALAIDSSDIRAMNGLGIALDYLGNHGAAQTIYKNALDEKSDDMTTLGNLGHSYVLSGAYVEAIALLEPYQKDKRANAALRQNLAEAYGMIGMDIDAERVSRMDLSVEQTKHNLAYYRARREQLSVAPKLFADLGSYPTAAMAENKVGQIKTLFPAETAGLVLNVAPEIKAAGGTPSFTVRALGFARIDKVRIFCDKLKKQNIACIAHG